MHLETDMRLTRDHAEGFHRPRGIAGISGRVARAWVHLGIVVSLQAAPGDGGELLRVEERERESASRAPVTFTS